MAKKLIEITNTSDVLLEAGCGSAEISAQLALSGRSTVLADFSDEILKRARRVYETSQLAVPRCVCCDLTQPLLVADDDVDVVWSSGVLEHWTDDELVPILAEMRRVSRRQVISLVPNANSVFYRFGKHIAERKGVWPYGRELPRSSLKTAFATAGLKDIQEFTLKEWDSSWFLHFIDERLCRLAEQWWNSLEPDDPVRESQGYLLVTIGSK